MVKLALNAKVSVSHQLEGMWSYTTKRQSRSLPQLLKLTPKDAISFLANIKTSSSIQPIVDAIIPEVIDRLSFMEKVDWITLGLDRETSSLSGGESQRIRLAGQLGSNLSGVLYVLDEPSIGLHPMDNSRLIESLRELQSRGNSLLVVEHDQETILQADYLIDVGPLAGRQGGEIVAHGTPEKVCQNARSQTGQYMREGIPHPLRKSRRILSAGKKNQISGLGWNYRMFITETSMEFPCLSQPNVCGGLRSVRFRKIEPRYAGYLRKELVRQRRKRKGC